jgi:hypothetical protein
MSVASLPSISCAEIAPSSISWLWKPYLARGKLAVLDGDPGTGKSFATIDLAARISRGAPHPGDDVPTQPGTVLLLNAEDDATDTILPRVIAAGAEPARVRIVAAPGLGLERLPQFPADLGALEEAIHEHSAALVVIDPMMAFFPPEVSANNDQSIRKALTPLAALAATTGAAILFVRHLRKAGGASALYRGLGSIGILGAVRTGLLISRHPDDAELRILTMTKTNVGRPGRSLGFRLREDAANGQTVVDWTGSLNVTADDLCGGGVSPRAGRLTRDRAVDWLRQFLAAGPRRATDVQASASAAGIAEITLRRAKEQLKVKSEATREKDVVVWWWRDPAAPKVRVTDVLPPLQDLDPLPRLADLD